MDVHVLKRTALSIKERLAASDPSAVGLAYSVLNACLISGTGHSWLSQQHSAPFLQHRKKR
jgi:hypothetical protein